MDAGLVTEAFRLYEQQRAPIMEEFISVVLPYLPSKGRIPRKFPIGDNTAIQMVTAVLLNMLQAHTSRYSQCLLQPATANFKSASCLACT